MLVFHFGFLKFVREEVIVDAHHSHAFWCLWTKISCNLGYFWRNINLITCLLQGTETNMHTVKWQTWTISRGVRSWRRRKWREARPPRGSDRTAGRCEARSSSDCPPTFERPGVQMLGWWTVKWQWPSAKRLSSDWLSTKKRGAVKKSIKPWPFTI